MSLGRPPSSHPSRDTDPRLAAARGLARDALGSLRNLEQLLKSIRVGPRALSAVIPNVHASCEPLLGAVRELLAALRGELPDSHAPDALEAFFAPRVEALEQALAAAQRGPLNAKSRLALEAAVGKSAHELDSARALIDLLDDALHGPAVRVDLLELVRSAATWERADTDGMVTVEATLATPASSIELVVNPRLAMWLLGVSIQLMAEGEPPTVPHITLAVTESEGGLLVTRGPGEGERLALVSRPLTEATLPCARTAAKVAGAHIAHGESSCSIKWSAPTG